MALDVGDKRIGVALSDPCGILSSPLTIIERNDNDGIRAILEIVERHQVSRIIVGLPRSMDGSIGKQAEKVQAFVNELVKQTKLPVEFRDERLSTVSAQRLIRDAGKSGRKVRDDAIAAAVILQSFLDERPMEDDGGAVGLPEIP